MTDTYTPPAVWTWDKANGGQFANINRPIARFTGPTQQHQNRLHMIRLELQTTMDYLQGYRSFSTQP